MTTAGYNNNVKKVKVILSLNQSLCGALLSYLSHILPKPISISKSRAALSYQTIPVLVLQHQSVKALKASPFPKSNHKRPIPLMRVE